MKTFKLQLQNTLRKIDVPVRFLILQVFVLLVTILMFV